MIVKSWPAILAATFGSSVLFVCLAAFSLGLAQFNAATTPTLPWFAVPVLLVVFGTAGWCDKRWDIGLRTPCKAPVGLVSAFAVASMLAAKAVWILENVWHGKVEAFPQGPEGTSLLFLVTYWVAISIALSMSSEVCFRGIMQSQLSRHLALWAAIALVVFFNTISHPWATLLPRVVEASAFLFAWAWLRHISGSLKACILTHIAAIMGGNIVLWFTGPVDFGALSQPTVIAVAIAGLLALVVCIYLSRRITGNAVTA